ncbi:MULTISPECIES: MFS transporter [Pseudomonas]|uniref:MFS transporter n=1 Tax=Pseudomonas TaxID=286 RepID=UPI00192E1F63|nr:MULTISPECIES: MFS transporter [Pseudomonas]BDM22266.1 MFS transporter [Pseudomonas sp. LRP2-20]
MQSTSISSWPTPIRALRHREFRFYFFGQAFSHLGKWIQQVGLSWLVYHLTSSATLLGIATFCSLAPQLIVGPAAGAWADKVNKRFLLIVVLALLAIQALTLAVLTALELVTPIVIILMSLLLGVLNAIENPLRQAMISGFIGHKDDIPNGLALNAMLFNASRFIGPPLAGLLVALTGEAACFALNSLAFIAPLIAIVLIPGRPQPAVQSSLLNAFKEGLSYSFSTPIIRVLMLSVVVVNVTAASYAVLLPIVTKDMLDGDSKTLGGLWGAAGFGALAATILLSALSNTSHLKRIIAAALIVSCGGMFLLSSFSEFNLSLLALCMMGFGISCTNVSSNILLQTYSPDHMRGRVVSLYISLRSGFEAVGGLVAGWLASYYGAKVTFGVEGSILAILAIGLYFQFARAKQSSMSES